MSQSVPLPIPPEPEPVYIDTVTAGPPILPIERIKLYSPEQWEIFVLEWAHYLKSKYACVERCGGAGDMGRDVIAFPDKNNTDIWDNYQCKRYDHPLRPSDIWIELGKLVYYTFMEEFSYPREYWFVAPQGAGTTLAKLLKKPDALKQQLIQSWDKHCRWQITSTQEVSLDTSLRTYLESLNFTIFNYVPILRLIDEHRSTPYHLVRFGGSLPTRPECPCPPDSPAPQEITYLKKLFDAYGNHLKRDVKNHVDIENEKELKAHYGDSRIEFYSAESLRNFSRDTLPLGTYEDLQNEVYDGIRDVIRDDHEDGYRRVTAVVKAAKSLQLTSHALVPRLHVRDRGGICHQLANERENVKWVKE